MMLRFEHDRRRGDDPMVDGKTSSMSSQRYRTRHPIEARCGNKSKKNKIAEGDEDDQWTRLIGR